MDNTTDPAAAYVAYVKSLDRSRFKPLDNFLSSPESSSPTEISQIISNASGGFNVEEGPICPTPAELAKLLQRPERRIFLIQNLSSDLAKTLGGYLNLDAEFFLEYLHAMVDTDHKTTTMNTPVSRHRTTDIEADLSTLNSLSMPDKGSETGTKNTPLSWYRTKNIAGDLPILNSLRRHANFIHMRFIGLREYMTDSKTSKDCIKPDVRLHSDLEKINVDRIAGMYVPIPRDDAVFSHVALIRRVMSIWFGRPKGMYTWTIGLILLDSPFEAKDAEQYGKRQDSVYRSFMPSPTPPNLAVHDRRSYRATLVKCLEKTPDLESPAAHHLMLVLQCALRLVASEWIAASGYIERDINSIEWQLENEAVGIDGLTYFLNQLYVGRRRVRKYQALIAGQLELLRARNMLPAAWRADRAPVILADMRMDFAQARAAIKKNSQRIAQTWQLITSVMNVRQGEQSIQQNFLLGFLTLVATLSVPFNAVAAILGMQTTYGPGQADFGKFWSISGIVISVVFGIGIIFMVTFRFKLYRRVTRG